MPEKMDMTAERAFEIYLVLSGYRRAMIEWGMGRLAAGSDCASTILLAGADFEADDEVVRLFRRAAGEEGVFLPDAEDELPWLERWICEEIVGGRVDPQDGLTRLFRLWVASRFDERFARWMWLSESVELTKEGSGLQAPFYDIREDELDATIVREAKALIEGDGEEACGCEGDGV